MKNKLLDSDCKTKMLGLDLDSACDAVRKQIAIVRCKDVDCDCSARRWMETNGCLLAVAGEARNTLDTFPDWCCLHNRSYLSIVVLLLLLSF